MAERSEVGGGKYRNRKAGFENVACRFTPTVEIRKDLGEFETLLSIDKARGALGYDPNHSWRDHL